MLHKKILLYLTPLTILLAAAIVPAQQPNFSPAIWGDGQLWGTKAVTVLPTPNPNAQNSKSFDSLFVFVNSNNPSPQLPISEAAPGNPAYNGGRWFTHAVEWTEAGFAAHGGVVPILTSYQEIQLHAELGHLAIAAGSPLGGPPLYFLCPLLPVK